MKPEAAVRIAFPERTDMNVHITGSKSGTNRALIIAALAGGISTIRNASPSGDVARLIAILREIGFSIDMDRDTLTVTGRGGTIPAKRGEFNVGNAGTVMRFLTPFLALGDGRFILDGDERMRQRPIGDLVDAVNQLGGDAWCVNNNGFPPVEINARGLNGGWVRLTSPPSSQFISALLLVAPFFKRNIDLTVEGESPSKPYIDSTMRIMKQFEADVWHRDYRTYGVTAQPYRPASMTIAGDADGANYFLAMTAVRGGTIRLTGMPGLENAWEGAFPRLLAAMGCRVAYNPDGLELTSDGRLSGGDFDMNDIPDSVQTLACAALFAKGTTTIRNIANLRVKETDRIAALVSELSRIGAGVSELPDGIVITPSPEYRPALIETYNDHRMVMAFSIAAARIEGIAVKNPSCVAKSLPDFFAILEQNGCRVEIA